MKLAFTKMHGLGNDFVVFNFCEQSIELSKSQAAYIADRKLGVGCDQILIVEKSSRDQIDFKYRIFNSDGSEVEQCGNGARCFSQFVLEQGLSDKNPLTVETKGGDITLERIEGRGVKVNMGPPSFSAESIPLSSELEAGPGSRADHAYSLTVLNQTLCFYALSMGNPHAVLVVDDVNQAEVELLGPELESHPIFPMRANIGFMQIVDRQHINLRVFERGVGETQACGTGACAAVVAGIKAGLLDNSVEVTLPGGTLRINWQGGDADTFMVGPASTVFQGQIEL